MEIGRTLELTKHEENILCNILFMIASTLEKPAKKVGELDYVGDPYKFVAGFKKENAIIFKKIMSKLGMSNLPFEWAKDLD